MTEKQTYTIGFCEQYVTINCYGRQAREIAEFLFIDLFIDSELSTSNSYDIMAVGNQPKLSLWNGEKKLYFGECPYSLAYILVNGVIYQPIVKNDRGQAIHSAALGYEDKGVLFPGNSGSGKSTLAAWLVARGCNYLTDELVLLSLEEQRIYPFTRPISIRNISDTILASFFKGERKKIFIGENGCMLPHRLLNSNFSPDTPQLSLIIFPEYRSGAQMSMTELSGAMACSRLISCYVNARNIEEHGINRLADVVRKTPVFHLVYSNFNDLAPVVTDYFPNLLK